MNKPPTIAEEIDRKVTEALISTIERRKSLAIGAREYRARVWSLWDMSAGLVGEETRELIEEALDADNKRALWDRISFFDGHEIRHIEWSMWPHCKLRIVDATADADGRIEPFIVSEEDFDGDWGARKAVIRELTARYRAEGWKRI